MDELSDREKDKLIKEALKWVEPIAVKYELDNELGRAALIEAFQAGIKFIYKETKEG